MIDKKDVEYVANLARLEVSEDEKNHFTKELGAIVGYIEKLNSADTQGVEPTAYMEPVHDPLRDDIIKPSFSIEKSLANGPSVKKGHFAVPKVIG